MKDKKHGLLETSVLTVKIILCLMFAFICYLFVFYGLTDKSAVMEQDPVQFIRSWDVTDSQGETTTAERYYVTDKDYDRNITIRSAGCDEHCDKMRTSLAANDIKAYVIEAHTIKSNMATIGLKDLSEQAKKHEFAAKDNDTEFITADSESFISEYAELCGKLRG